MFQGRLEGYFNAVYKEVLKVFQESFKSISRKFQGTLKAVSRGNFKGI